MTDHTTIHAKCVDREHLVDLFLFQGRPVNTDQTRPVTVLVNSGYAVGYCPARRQSLWAGYRVAGFDRDVDYDRPHLYYDDTRLDVADRVGPDTFGRQNSIQYHVGHLVPNEAINRQFGRLAQMETFFMSNMSPQRGSLNNGVWRRFEGLIRNIEDTGSRDHVWAIAGPIFGANPDMIDRPNGTTVPIPEAYYYITVDPFRWPWNTPSVVDIAYFIFPQDADHNTPLDAFIASRDEIEQRTDLRFFPNWTGPSIASTSALGTPEIRHRLLRQLM